MPTKTVSIFLYHSFRTILINLYTVNRTKSNILCSIDSNDEDSTLSSTDVEPNRQESMFNLIYYK